MIFIVTGHKKKRFILSGGASDCVLELLAIQEIDKPEIFVVFTNSSITVSEVNERLGYDHLFFFSNFHNHSSPSHCILSGKSVLIAENTLED
jgi:hypothetical protein